MSDSKKPADGQQEATPLELKEEDIESLAGKLADWSLTLPQEEKALLQLILARARGGGFGLTTTEGDPLPLVKETTLLVLKPFVKRAAARAARASNVWVEVGEITWLKRTPQ